MMDELIPRDAVEYICRKETVSTNPDDHKYSNQFMDFMDDDAIADFGRWKWANGFNTALVTVKVELAKLLSAEPEIIRCRDCKHYKEWESEFTPNAVVTQCMADNFPIRKAIPDGWFCAGAERRTDE